MDYKPYRPSLKSLNKFPKYAEYFLNYVQQGDWRSLAASFNYLVLKRNTTKSYVAKSPFGEFLIRKGTNDFQFINASYEKEIHKYLNKQIGSFDIFIDAGACIGEYCVSLGKRGIPCFAIEPVNYDALQCNISINDLKSIVTTFEGGLGSQSGMAYFEKMAVVTSSSRIDRNANKAPNTKIFTLDELFKDVKSDKNIMLKMDVEGMESEVLEGGTEFLSRAKNLRIIYEHTSSGNDNITEVLSKIGHFEFISLDPVNVLATKTAPP